MGPSSFCWHGRTEPVCFCTSYCGLLPEFCHTCALFWVENCDPAAQPGVLDSWHQVGFASKGHWQMTRREGRKGRVSSPLSSLYTTGHVCALHRYRSSMAPITHTLVTLILTLSRFPGLCWLPIALTRWVPLCPICSLDLTQTSTTSFFIKVSASEAKTGGTHL